MRKSYQKNNHANVFPNCPSCGKPIRMIRRTGGLPALRVETKLINWRYKDYDTQHLREVTVISARDKKYKYGAVIVNDGIRGYLPHVCKG